MIEIVTAVLTLVGVVGAGGWWMRGREEARARQRMADKVRRRRAEAVSEIQESSDDQLADRLVGPRSGGRFGM